MDWCNSAARSSNLFKCVGRRIKIPGYAQAVIFEKQDALCEGLDAEVILDQQRMIGQLRKSDPKPPGRKLGQGYFRFRGEQAGVAGGEPIPVPVGIGCPNCGGALGEAEQEIVSTTDIPLTGCGEVRRHRVEIRKCARCGKSVRGQHPDIAPGQQGATAHRVGARARSAAQLLHYGHGVPVRKVPAILEELTGIRLTQGVITQDAMKQAAGAVGRALCGLAGIGEDVSGSGGGSHFGGPAGTTPPMLSSGDWRTAD